MAKTVNKCKTCDSKTEEHKYGFWCGKFNKYIALKDSCPGDKSR